MSKNIGADKGGIAEEALAAHFRHAGFFALRGLPFRHDGEDVTDVDVWLYEFGSGEERRRFIVDSKNKVKPKLVERLFWTAGARDALRVDGAYVASSSIRDATRRLARRLNLDVVDLQLIALEDPALLQRLTREELGKLVADADRTREGKKWRNNINDSMAAVLSSFGGGSANTALRSAGFFAEQAMATSPGCSLQQLACRLFYLSVAMAAVGYDHVVANAAYQVPDRQREEVEDIVRYGADYVETKRQLQVAEQLVRQYLTDGSVLANQLHEKIARENEEFPADVIAEVVMKMSPAGELFTAAKDLEMAAHMRVLPAYASLTPETRSICGAVMDFVRFDRVDVAEALNGAAAAASTKPAGGKA
jgi:hypothetical protein